jgi:hypothetical protein
MSFILGISRRNAFLISWFVVFLVGLDFAPETNLLVLAAVSLAYGVVVFLPAYLVFRLLRHGGEGVLLAMAFVLVILVGSVVVGTYEYRFRDTRNVPRDVYVAGASYLTGLIGGGGTPLPETAPGNATSRIDAAWVQQFMGIVNTMRSSSGVPPMVQNATLDEFAKMRATTAIAHNGISHYGRDQDYSCFFVNCIPSSELGRSYYVYNSGALNSVLGKGATYQQPSTNGYWQLTLSCSNCTSTTVYFLTQQSAATYLRLAYGNHTRLAFSGDTVAVAYPSEPTEEILYPYGTPSSYAAFLQQVATAHWSGFLDGTVRSYGVDLEPGVAIIPSGACSVTEIPGPNIDIAEFFSQHGCSFYYGLADWLVIELGN